MKLLKSALKHIFHTAQVPSFSSYEERIHPLIIDGMMQVGNVRRIEAEGNNLIFRIPGNSNPGCTVALAAHLDKINHYGNSPPDQLSVKRNEEFIEGAMDDSVGLGILLALAEASQTHNFPDLLFFFSEMEESMGLKEHAELLKNGGKGYECGMGARSIASTCLELGIIPDEVITVDTTPLFKKQSGVALYSRHWEFNGIDPSQELIAETEAAVRNIKGIDRSVKLSNNTNDYLQYGKVFNEKGDHVVVSVALEPAIYPYHQKRERVFIKDIRRVLNILERYLESS